jgi:hypothetical protein
VRSLIFNRGVLYRRFSAVVPLQPGENEQPDCSYGSDKCNGRLPDHFTLADKVVKQPIKPLNGFRNERQTGPRRFRPTSDDERRAGCRMDAPAPMLMVVKALGRGGSYVEAS